MTKLNKKLVWVLVGIVPVVNLYFPAGLFAHAGGHGDPEAYLEELKKDPVETVMGRILSLPCYLKHGASSLNYDRCYRSSLAKKYLSAALLTPEGDLYLLIMDHEDAFRAVKELISENVTAKGRLVEKNGIEALVLQSIKKTAKSEK